MAPMKCTICHKPIVLVPSARQRAERYGGVPEYYTRLFTAHAKCRVEERTLGSQMLARRIIALNPPHTSATSNGNEETK